jgi:AcrR family transcriptional regulator
MSDTRPAGPPMGLRERKKARTRAAIRTEAMRLFRERGYAATTVEQIAAAADISPATFFRYYPTKEDVVLQDDLDLLLPEAVEAQPPSLGPIAAVRAAVAQALGPMGPAELDRLQETIALSASVPEIRARAADEFTRTIEVMAAPLARRAGVPRTTRRSGTWYAMIGVIWAATMVPPLAVTRPTWWTGSTAPLLTWSRACRSSRPGAGPARRWPRRP